MIIIDGNADAPRNAVGGKAFHLNKLVSMDVSVPPTVVIPAMAEPDIDAITAWLTNTFQTSGPWPLAIRSSSAFEDAEHQSSAGHYLSLLDTLDAQSMVSAIERVRASGPEMAVVVQPLLAAHISGVAFSCNPLTYARGEISIAWTTGLADALVAGDVAGECVVIDQNGAITDGSWPLNASLLEEIVANVKKIERAYDLPVDIEWVIDADRKLWIVQARPVVLPGFLNTLLDTVDHFDALPNVVKRHPKIRLRRHACEKGVAMASAIVECWPAHEPIRDAPRDDLSNPAGVSVVLLHPERVQHQVVREFASVRGCDVDFFTRGCRRYCIRRYPQTAGVTAAKRSVLQAGLANSWLSVAIVQAVWDAAATGIIRRSSDGYLIEIAQGHFVPKGVVPTSTIILDHARQVISATWSEQPMAYRFIDGHVVTEAPPEHQLKLDADTLGRIAAVFDPLFELYHDAALEFGIIETKEGYDPYLIDVAEGDTAGIDLDIELIRSGVLSVGSCRGHVHRVNLSAIGALDSHLHDRPEEAIVPGSGDVIIVAERASVDLLPFVGAPGVVGFVFERGSILAHLAVVLREKGLPAVALDDTAFCLSLEEGRTIELDASTRNISKSERIRMTGAADAVDHRLVHQSRP